MDYKERNIFQATLVDASAEITSDVVPIIDKNAVAICLSSSNQYAPFLCVTLNSIMVNSNPNLFYDVVVLTTDMSQSNKNSISKFVDARSNFSIRFFDVTDLVTGKSFYTWAHFTAFTYYRLLIPDLFEQYSKIVYLDCDIVVNVDIATLFQTDMDGYLLAAAQDTHVMGRADTKKPSDIKYYQELLKANIYGYYQAGVMLFNIKGFSAKYGRGELINKASQTNYRWLDQDFLNVECRGQIKRLENAWNVMIINNPNNIDELLLSDSDYEGYLEARRNPKIIHYVGRSIPCYSPAADMYQYYWVYARNTPYYELILSMMVTEAEMRVNRKIAETERRVIGQRPTLKQRIKAKWIMPLVNKVLPKGTQRRRFIKKIYFKLRGWSVD